MADNNRTPSPAAGAVTHSQARTKRQAAHQIFDDLGERRGQDFALCLALRDELERQGAEDLTQARRLCELLFDRLGDIADLQTYRQALCDKVAR